MGDRPTMTPTMTTQEPSTSMSSTPNSPVRAAANSSIDRSFIQQSPSTDTADTAATTTDAVEEQNDDESHNLMTPLMANTASTSILTVPSNESPTKSSVTSFRSRKTKKALQDRKRRQGRRNNAALAAAKNVFRFWGISSCSCCSSTKCISRDKQREVCRSITAAMNVLARVTFWTSVVALVACVIWYSYELKNNGTDPHLIAWFSAGAFVLLGFPISMYGIIMHLANYNQPNVQCYIVRILWMVPIYSLESWLCLRFHDYAIYIETLRDCYEAYVLYNFMHFLIQVLGGEEELVLMLKDKSPTRGVHMWGLQWCVRPWLMGQPVSRTVLQNNQVKRVHWTSPFFVKCKFGVLQYVLLKVVSSIFVMILELHGLYKEGDFTPKGGYLYICILTNTSQCWALYCLIFFYFATKNELGPIRPVGKFLSVKALVFFTWWQSVMISMLYQAGMIPHYDNDRDAAWTSEDVAKGLQDYLICIEMFLGAIVHIFVFPHTDYLAEAVAARNASYQHSPPQRNLKKRLGRRTKTPWSLKDDKSYCSKQSSNANEYDLEMAAAGLSSLDPHAPNAATVANDALNDTVSSEQQMMTLTELRDETVKSLSHAYSDYSAGSSVSDDDSHDNEEGHFVNDNEDSSHKSQQSALFQDTDSIQQRKKTGFVRALLESTIPMDVMDNTVGIVKGDYHVEKKTLLHHAATSDQYDLFSARKTFRNKTSPPRQKNSKEQE